MQKDQEKVLSIAREQASSVRKVLHARGVYFYGSYARGMAGNDSDIDIAVVVDGLLDGYLSALSLLCQELESCEKYGLSACVIATKWGKSSFSLCSIFEIRMIK